MVLSALTKRALGPVLCVVIALGLEELGMGVDGVAIHVVHVGRVDARVKLGLAKPTRNTDEF